MSDKVERYQEVGVESVPPDDDFAHWVTGKEMERRESVSVEQYHEFGVESVPPDDDFAYWVTQKEVEKVRRQLAETVREGLTKMPK
jgi:hypothetical protein